MTTLSRIGFLDGVRGLAAALVVVHHALESQSETYLRWSYAYANLGRIGVVAFFLVSGYVIPLSLEKQDLRTFGVRRFWRLYPVYWVALGSYLLVQVLAGDGLGASPAVLTVNVLMVQGLIGAPLVLGPSWTLGIELAF